ncbi:MAG: hypothetical protein LBJ02_11795, partial [Bifidobacteriaceae bacterium]|nr:hypothetical protein [Bifidobacteriaceae bacterium]
MNALVAGAAVVVVSMPGGAPAAYADGGLNWYYEDTGVAEVVASGFDGEGITIAVLDGFIDTSLPIFADADI